MTSSDSKLTKQVIPQPFASGSGAAKIAIDTASGNTVNFSDGFPAAFSSPHASGGKYIQRGNINALGELASRNQFIQQCGGLYQFDQSVCTAIGGYPKGAILAYVVDNVLYHVKSLIENNQVNYITNGVDGVNWAWATPSKAAQTYPDYSKQKTLIASGSANTMTPGTPFKLIEWATCSGNGLGFFEMSWNIECLGMYKQYANVTIDGVALQLLTNSTVMYQIPFMAAAYLCDEATPNMTITANALPTISNGTQFYIAHGSDIAQQFIPLHKGTKVCVYILRGNASETTAQSRAATGSFSCNVKLIPAIGD